MRSKTAILLFSLLSLTTSSQAAETSDNFVPNEKTARAIAIAILEARLGDQRYDILARHMRLIIEPDGEKWVAYFYPQKIATRNDGAAVVVAGGGSPTLELSKQDARVLAFYYAR